MSSTTKRMFAVVGLAVMTSASLPAVASAGGARLYEMTENMKITKNRGRGEPRGILSATDKLRRQATSQLIGTADLGTPLCPTALVMAMNPAAKECNLNATGEDDISLSTGRGNFNGKVTVTVQGDNNADSPELVVMKGDFKGKMDFSPAILNMIPLGTVVGKLHLDNSGGNVPFTGTFRLPFVIEGIDMTNGQPCTPAADNAVCMPVGDDLFWKLSGVPTPPLPLTPMERYDLTRMTRPFYLLDDGNIVPVGASEFGGGWAAVKFEIKF